MTARTETRARATCRACAAIARHQRRVVGRVMCLPDPMVMARTTRHLPADRLNLRSGRADRLCGAPGTSGRHPDRKHARGGQRTMKKRAQQHDALNKGAASHVPNVLRPSIGGSSWTES